MKDLLELIQKQDLSVTIFIIIIFSLIYMVKKGIPALIAKDLEIFKHQNTEEIAKLKAELEKQKLQIEHFHQVSQPTYQKLFEKKINIYQELIDIELKHDKILIDKNIENEDDYYENIDLFINELNDIERIISNNKLFISNKLIEAYEKLKEKEETFNSKFKDLALAHYTNLIDDDFYKKENKKIKQTIYEKTKKEFSNFHNILANDIQKIKTKINLD